MHPAKLYPCEVTGSCRKEFDSWSALQLHVKIVHKPSTCSVCNKTYFGSSDFAAHITSTEHLSNTRARRANLINNNSNSTNSNITRSTNSTPVEVTAQPETLNNSEIVDVEDFEEPSYEEPSSSRKKQKRSTTTKIAELLEKHSPSLENIRAQVQQAVSNAKYRRYDLRPSLTLSVISV